MDTSASGQAGRAPGGSGRHRRRSGIRGAIAVSVSITAALTLIGPAVAAAKWTRITDPDGINTDEVGLARGLDGNLHVLWHRHDGPNNEALVATTLSSGGKQIAESTIVQGWTAINPSVEAATRAINLPDGEIVALWSGLRSTAPSEQLDGELVRSTSTDGGTSWSPASAASKDADKAYVGNGIGGGADPRKGATALAGTWGDSGPGDHGFSFGPGLPSPTFDATAAAGVIYPELAFDAQTGAPYAGWQSLRAGNQGIYARAITALGTAGPALYAPDSSSNNRTAFDNQQERTAISGRNSKGGVYMAYGKGYPFAAKVLLWKVGAAKAKSIAKATGDADAEHVSIAAGPSDGRMWVFWEDGERIFATRTDPAAKKGGGIVKLKPPKGTSTVYGLSGEGSNGKLDLMARVGLAGGAVATWHSQVKPGLLVKTKGAKASAAGRAVAAGKRKKVTFTVSDAGSPIKGAKVKVGKASRKTNGKGKASLRLPRGKSKATVSKGGYSTAKLKLRV